jgi:hypothetical protein
MAKCLLLSQMRLYTEKGWFNDKMYEGGGIVCGDFTREAENGILKFHFPFLTKSYGILDVTFWGFVLLIFIALELAKKTISLARKLCAKH